MDSNRTTNSLLRSNAAKKGDVALLHRQRQHFTHHFGLDALLWPDDKELIFDTSAPAGSEAHGQEYTFKDEYAWLGFTAREKIFSLLSSVLEDDALFVDVFAYDFNETGMIKILLELGKEGRARIILDSSTLHHSNSSPKPEDEFESLFTKSAGSKQLIKRGKFGRYSLDKVLIISKQSAGTKSPVKVLTGSTNFSLTGLYVNSNMSLCTMTPK